MKKLLFLLFLALPIAAQNASTSGRIVAGNATCMSANCVYYQLPANTPYVVVTISGTWSGTINFQSISAPNANYSNLNSVPWQQVAVQTGNGNWSVATGGATFLLAQAPSWSSGTATVTMTASQTGSPINNPVFPGTVTTSSVVIPGAPANTFAKADGSGYGTAAANANYKILPLSGDTTGATDTAALQALVNSGHVTVLLNNGSYYLSGVTISNPGVSIIGGGIGATNLYETSTTGRMFTVNYGITWIPTTTNDGSLFRGFSILPYSGVTQTAGGAFLIGQSDPTKYLIGLRIEDVSISGLWSGIYLGNYQVSNWFKNIYCHNTLSGGDGCIRVNTALGGGDDHFDSVEAQGHNTGVFIDNADTMEFSHLKVNGSGVVFSPTATNITRVRFIDPSIEGYDGLPTCGIDFGASLLAIFQNQVIGGSIDLINGTAFCNFGFANQENFYQANIWNTTDGHEGMWQSYANIVGLETLGIPGGGQLTVSGGSFPFLQAYNASGNIVSDWVNDVANGAAYFDYSGTAAGAAGKFTIRNKVGGGTTVFNLDKDGLMYHNNFTVATLPTCNSSTQDAETIVSDATAFSAGSAPTGGGTFHVPVYCQNHNGSYAWITY